MKKLSLILFAFIAIQAMGQKSSNLKEHFRGEKKLTLSEEVHQKFSELVKEKVSSKTTAGNKTIEELVLFWNNNGWNDTIHKTEFVLNNLDQLVTWYHYIYDFGKFEYFRKIEYTYDQAGNNIGSEIHGYNSSTSTWYPASKETKIYDSYNNMIEYKLELPFAGQWQIEFMEYLQYKYNSNGKITEKIEIAQFKNSAPKFIEKEEITYNASGKDSIFIYYEFDTTQTAWVPFEKIHEIIWSGNNIIGAETQFYKNGGWDNYHKIEISYDSLDREIYQVAYIWEGTNLVWNNISKNTFSYFQNGDLDTVAMYQWTGTDWILADGEKFTYSYNSTNDLISSERQLYEVNLQSWVKTLKHIYNYSIISGVNVPQTAGNEIIVYPNPAKDQVTVSGLDSDDYQVAIFDMNGRFISDHKPDGSKASIDLSELSNGFYFIQVKGKDISKTIKIVKN